MKNLRKKTLFSISDREPRKWRVKMLRLCRSGVERLSNLSPSERWRRRRFTCVGKNTSNTLWNIAFEKIGFGRRDYYRNWRTKKIEH